MREFDLQKIETLPFFTKEQIRIIFPSTDKKRSIRIYSDGSKKVYSSLLSGASMSQNLFSTATELRSNMLSLFLMR